MPGFPLHEHWRLLLGAVIAAIILFTLPYLSLDLLERVIQRRGSQAKKVLALVASVVLGFLGILIWLLGSLLAFKHHNSWLGWLLAAGATAILMCWLLDFRRLFVKKGVAS